MGNTYPVPTDGEPMPWRTLTVKEQRTEPVTLARKPGVNISELARRFGVSRKTVYKWLNRDDMDDRSCCPKNSPKRIPQAQEARILAARNDHPAWGGAQNCPRPLARQRYRPRAEHSQQHPAPQWPHQS